MNNATAAQEMDSWLSVVRARFAANTPDLLSLFDTYAEEARFGRAFIAADISNLPAGAALLEIGAGSMLLSCQLVREGFNVSALEPTGSGFSHFDKMRNIVLQMASEAGYLPKIINKPAESLNVQNSFDYAFSVNVMEHVADVGITLIKVCASLRDGGCYRFVCPNYLFPYEPHFNMPTFFSKWLTGKVLHQRIIHYTKIPDPTGTWASLNWINVLQVKRLVGRMRMMRLSIAHDTLGKFFERVTTDKRFSERRSSMIRNLIVMFVAIRAHRLLQLIPAFMQPVMDCRIEKLG